jgi:hypothetical protein
MNYDTVELFRQATRNDLEWKRATGGLLARKVWDRTWKATERLRKVGEPFRAEFAGLMAKAQWRLDGTRPPRQCSDWHALRLAWPMMRLARGRWPHQVPWFDVASAYVKAFRLWTGRSWWGTLIGYSMDSAAFRAQFGAFNEYIDGKVFVLTASRVTKIIVGISAMTGLLAGILGHLPRKAA